MDESTKSKRNREEKKNRKQQVKKSEIKNVNDGDGDDDSVFEDCQQQQVYLLLCSVYCLIYSTCDFILSDKSNRLFNIIYLI